MYEVMYMYFVYVFGLRGCVGVWSLCNSNTSSICLLVFLERRVSRSISLPACLSLSKPRAVAAGFLQCRCWVIHAKVKQSKIIPLPVKISKNKFLKILYIFSTLAVYRFFNNFCEKNWTKKIFFVKKNSFLLRNFFVEKTHFLKKKFQKKCFNFFSQKLLKTDV